MQYDPERITFFAKTDARGKEVPFGIKAADRTRHMYVIGKTGMGKSTMLENMAIQDIQNGEGMAFIDPHGSTAEKLLDYVPEERIKDVLYFAPFDMEHPVSFNVMEDVGADRRHLVVSGLMSTFKKIWVDAWSARMEYILSNTLLALLEYPGSTLLGVNRMLSDKSYRDAVVANLKDPSVRSFWVDEFAKYNERYMQEAGDAIKNKIGQFTANPLIRNIIGQPKSSFDIREIMDGKKIIIMNLSKGLVGETNANLLGSMLITRIYLSAMSRADMSPAQMAKMPNFYFYVDEFQSFANETFANILSEARKYKLNLTIAHQYIEQMEEQVRNAVFGNVGTTVAFRVGPFDAEVLETIFAPQFTATDIVNLGFAQVYLTLMIDGIGSTPFSAVTLAPIAPAAVSQRDRIVAASRSQYAYPRVQVEELIAKWHEPVRKPETKPPSVNQEHKFVPKPQQKVEQSALQPKVENFVPKKMEQSAPQPQSMPERSTPIREEVRERPPDVRPPQPIRRENEPRAEKGKTLGDLRSILATITKDVSKSAPKVAGSNAPEPEKKPDTKADLRSALDSALKTESLASTPPKSAPTTSTSPPTSGRPAMATRPPEKGNRSKEPTLDELQNMLKLGKRDQPPFRSK